MKYILAAFLSLSVLSCTPKKKEYFDFDEIDHYSIAISYLEIIELYDNPTKSELDSLKNELISFDTPLNISDLFFIDKLTKMGFKKTAIDKSKFTTIKNIFTEKEFTSGEYTACAPFYRDILIFKKQNKVIGTAKLCFDCMKYDIKGTIANTDNFGQNGDFEKLIEVLKNKK
jgi:hypothetical protein